MRIASFNINGIKARLPRVLEWLEETRPAVACLQEVKSQDENFPADEFEKIGSAAWRKAVAVAQIAHRELWDSPAKDALYFHATYVRPSWSRTKVARAKIDSHIFYR